MRLEFRGGRIQPGRPGEELLVEPNAHEDRGERQHAAGEEPVVDPPLSPGGSTVEGRGFRGHGHRIPPRLLGSPLHTDARKRRYYSISMHSPRRVASSRTGQETRSFGGNARYGKRRQKPFL